MNQIIFEKFSFEKHFDELHKIRCSDVYIESCTWRISIPKNEDFRTELQADFKNDRIAQYMAFRFVDYVCVGTIWLYHKFERVFVSGIILPNYQSVGYAIQMYIEVFKHWSLHNNQIHNMYFEAYATNTQSNPIMKRIFKHEFSKDGKEYYSCDRAMRDMLIEKYDRKPKT